MDFQTPDSGLVFTLRGSPPEGAGIKRSDNRYIQIDPTLIGAIDQCDSRTTDPDDYWDEESFNVGFCRGPLPVPDQQAPIDHTITLDLSEYEAPLGDGTEVLWTTSGGDTPRLVVKAAR